MSRLLCVIMVCIVLGVSACSAPPTPLPTPYRTPTPQTYKVTYRVRGSARADLTYEALGGSTEQRANIRLPWEYDQMFYVREGAFVYVSAQNTADHGWVECQILLDGQVAKSARSEGGYVIATCSGAAGR